MEKYSNCEALVDDFVSNLLKELMFYSGWLYVTPQLSLDFYFGKHVTEAKTDKTIMDIISFYLMAVVEDKSVDNVKINSETQMIEEAIAAHQQKKKIKLQESANKKQKLKNNNNNNNN
jgi:hypothetical protein